MSLQPQAPNALHDAVRTVLEAARGIAAAETIKSVQLEDESCESCEAAVAFLARATRRRFSLLARPDKAQPRIGNQPKAVERVYTCGRAALCCEHTRLETYPKQLLDDRVFQEVLRPVEIALLCMSKAIPRLQGIDLYVDVGAFQGRRPGEYGELQLALVEWVVQNLPTEAVVGRGSPRPHSRGVPNRMKRR